jgi:rare lipoprotein A
MAVLLLSAGLILGGCATIRRPEAAVEEGLASWYGPGFHGRSTSNKEIYDMYDMTAAHRILPFGTHVMVTNLRNGRSVTVRINDRGPFVRDRVIDLSYAAARLLDMLGPGVVPVRIEVLPEISPSPSAQRFSVQVGSFVVESNAEALKNSLLERYPSVYLTAFRTPHRTYFRVRIRAESRKKAQAVAERLSAEGFAVIILEEE